MNFTYAILLLFSFFFPLVLSFDRKVQFYKKWKFLFPSIISVALVYILFDIFLTYRGVWGFNSNYLVSFSWLGLPLEEYLFFIIIPYSSIFIHECICVYYPKVKLNNQLTKTITSALLISALIVVLTHVDKTYTTYAFIKIIVLLSLSFFDKTEIMNRFYITFFVILIPFTLINGVLTGSIINDPVVWYNDEEILGLRIFTIPIEDSLYAFSLIGFGLLLRMKLVSVFTKQNQKVQ